MTKKPINNNEICSLTSSEFTMHQVTLKNLLIFELKSLIGRIFFNRRPPINKYGINILNLGCAVTTFNGWINADFFPTLSSLFKRDNLPDWMLDLRFPLNCPPDVWDGVFCEHTLEHLYPVDVLNLLHELYRTMKPSAWVRFSVPDLEKYVSFYLGHLPAKEFSQWNTGCEAICNLTQNFHHISVWDAQLLSNFLERAGFRNIRQTGFRQGTDERLLKDRDGRRWESLYIEAQKI